MLRTLDNFVVCSFASVLMTACSPGSADQLAINSDRYGVAVYGWLEIQAPRPALKLDEDRGTLVAAPLMEIYGEVLLRPMFRDGDEYVAHVNARPGSLFIRISEAEFSSIEPEAPEFLFTVSNNLPTPNCRHYGLSFENQRVDLGRYSYNDVGARMVVVLFGESHPFSIGYTPDAGYFVFGSGCLPEGSIHTTTGAPGDPKIGLLDAGASIATPDYNWLWTYTLYTTTQKSVCMDRCVIANDGPSKEYFSTPDGVVLGAGAWGDPLTASEIAQIALAKFIETGVPGKLHEDQLRASDYEQVLGQARETLLEACVEVDEACAASDATIR